MVSPVQQARQSVPVPVSRLPLVALLAILLATAANLLIWLAAQIVLRPDPAFLPLNLGPIIFFTVCGVLGAVLVYGLIGRVSRRPVWLFRRVSVFVLLLTFIPDVSMLFGGGQSFPGATIGAVITLVLMHTASWAVCLLTLTRPVPSFARQDRHAN